MIDFPLHYTSFIEIDGVKVYNTSRGWFVHNGGKALNDRYYRGSEVDWKKVSCINNGKFINTHYFTPVVYDLEEQLPEYNPKWEVYKKLKGKNLLYKVNYPIQYRQYWEEQRRRCYEGYEVGGVRITGLHYFYLNFWRIKSKKVGETAITPWFLDVDKEFFDEVDNARNQGKNLIVVKRRQIGMSEKIAAIGAYYLVFYPNSETLYIAQDDKYSLTPFNKFKQGYSMLARESTVGAAPEFYKRLYRENEKQIETGFKYFGKTVGYGSKIFRIVVDNNPQAPAGRSPSIAFIDEAGIMRHLISTYNIGLLPAMQEGGTQGNRIVILIATGGEMEDGIAQLMEMFYNPDDYNLMSYPNIWDNNEGGDTMKPCGLFFPAWKYYVRDIDGNSYKKESVHIINENRKKMNSEKLHADKTQFPLNTEEAFTPSRAGEFDTEKLTEQRKYLINNNWKDKIQYGNLEWIISNNKRIGVKFVPSGQNHLEKKSNGDLKYPFKIIEHPFVPLGDGKYEQRTEIYLADPYFTNLYKSGTDSYDKPDAPASDSKGSQAIYKAVVEDTDYANMLLNETSNLPVASMTDRPKDPETFFENTIKLCLYYGRATNLIEWSNVTIFDYYKKNNFEYLLKEKPEIAYATVKDSKMNNKFGIDPNTKYVWVSFYRKYILEYVHNIYDLELIQRLIKFKNTSKYNCDVTIANMLAWLQIKDDQHYKTVKANYRKKKNTLYFGYAYDKNGRLISL